MQASLRKGTLSERLRVGPHNNGTAADPVLGEQMEVMAQRDAESDVDGKGTFPVGYSNQAVHFFFLLVASRQK